MNKPKILVVDDEVTIQNVLKIVLEKEGFEVLTALDGKIAQELLLQYEFKVIITDMNMPGSGGLELLKHTQDEYPMLPVVLMTGFTKIIETKTAFELGAKAFLAKPFVHAELMQALKDACGEPEPAEVIPEEFEEKNSESYCRIGIDEFVSGKTIKFEIFVSVNEEKFIKVAHAGEDIDLKRIMAFKSKGVSFLFIKKHDFAKYVGLNLSLVNAAKNSSAISREKKIQIAKHASVVIMENFFVNGLNQEEFSQAKEITETTLSLLMDSSEGYGLLEALSGGGDPLYNHSLGVSLFSALIAKEIGWDAPSTLYKISMAGLFHDIGMKEIDRQIVDKPRSLQSNEEIRILETHPTRAAAILSSIPTISEEIIQAVLQHHETADGRGYPSRVSGGKISTMARLIAVADKFCELAFSDANSVGMPPHKAIERLSLSEVSAIDLQFLNALIKVLGLTEKAPLSPKRKDPA